MTITRRRLKIGQYWKNARRQTAAAKREHYQQEAANKVNSSNSMDIRFSTIILYYIIYLNDGENLSQFNFSGAHLTKTLFIVRMSAIEKQTNFTLYSEGMFILVFWLFFYYLLYVLLFVSKLLLLNIIYSLMIYVMSWIFSRFFSL